MALPIAQSSPFFSPKPGRAAKDASPEISAVPSPEAWAAGLFAEADFGDLRLRRRAIQIAATLAAAPTDSIPQACGNWAETKAAYRFIENEKVLPSALRDSVDRNTAQACGVLDTVLVVQDTTDVVFPNAYEAKGLGPLNNTEAQGMFVHTALALRENGIAVGVVGQQCWCRPKKEATTKRKNRKRIKKPPGQRKESARWMETTRHAHRVIADQEYPGSPTRIIHVCDREGDIYELFETILSLGDGAVIRSTYDRRIETADGSQSYAHQSIQSQWPIGSVVIDVPRKRNEPARQAAVELLVQRQTLRAPASSKPCGVAVELTLVEVFEADPPEGVKPLHWLLWTTEPVRNLEEAMRIVAIYKKRWVIEEFHYILKSGCRTEEVRFHTAERIEKIVALYSPVAARILQLRDLARLEPEAPCTEALSENEWRALWTHIHKRPPSAKTPEPTLQQAVLWIGRLGGHLNRKGDGMPGVKTLWRGLRDLEMITHIYISLQKTS